MMPLLKNLVKNLIPGRYLLYKGKGRNREVALTFDDGPHPLYTQTILKTLEKNNVRATFFLRGSMAQRHPELVKAIIDKGHEIGNHTFSHKHIKKMRYGELSREFEQANRTIQNITKTSPRFLRPPYGELSISLLKYVFFNKMKIVMWSIDSNDSYDKSPTDIRNRLKAIKGGDIILLHEDYCHTMESLPSIVEDIKAKSLNFVLVSELIRGLTRKYANACVR